MSIDSQRPEWHGYVGQTNSLCAHFILKEQLVFWHRKLILQIHRTSLCLCTKKTDCFLAKEALVRTKGFTVKKKGIRYQASAYLCTTTIILY